MSTAYKRRRKAIRDGTWRFGNMRSRYLQQGRIKEKQKTPLSNLKAHNPNLDLFKIG